jgi:general stress protein 26
MRPEVSSVVFDSRVSINCGQAVYLTNVAELVPVVDLDRCLDVFSRSSEDRGGSRWSRDEVEPGARLRLYRASEHTRVRPRLQARLRCSVRQRACGSRVHGRSGAWSDAPFWAFGRNGAAAGRYPPGMDLRMTEDERQAFLADVHIGVISIERDDGPPLAVPIWYGYEPGGNVWVTTGADSLKSKLLNKAQRFSLCVQTEEAPFYSYVSVDGPVVSVEATDEDGVARPMAHRYFGAELGDLYLENIKGEASLTWTMRPERWWSVDHSKTGRVDPRTT